MKHEKWKKLKKEWKENEKMKNERKKTRNEERKKNEIWHRMERMKEYNGGGKRKMKEG